VGEDGVGEGGGGGGACVGSGILVEEAAGGGAGGSNWIVLGLLIASVLQRNGVVRN
jgi:hypothetical protein